MPGSSAAIWALMDGSLEPRPRWVVGDLYIAGAGVARGYWRDPQTTSSSFLRHPQTGERWYRTGDLGRYLPSGEIELLGREDLQVKVQGYRIELGEVEAVLGQHPELSAVVACAVGAARGSRRLVAYYVASSAAAPVTEELRRFAAEQLPEYMVPSAFVQLDELPLSSNGKVDRSALPEPAAAGAAVAAEVAAETRVDGHLVGRIADLIAAVLEVPEVAAQDNLLELGATSMQMLGIANALEETFGSRPPLDQLVRLASAAEIAGFYAPRWAADQRFAGDLDLADSDLADSGLTAAVLPIDFQTIEDPAQREQFKRRQPALRELPEAPTVDLPEQPLSAEIESLLDARRSWRSFSQQPIAQQRFTFFRGCLRRSMEAGSPRYRFGSAGGLYPIQTYLYLKPERIEGMAGGTYYYHPGQHQLLLLSNSARIERETYGWINRPLFDSAAFAIFLIADLHAIAPLYGAMSRDLCLIEAGLMSQLLELTAPLDGLGLCQIGSCDFASLRAPLALADGHIYLHGLLGGAVEESNLQLSRDEEEWDEGEL